MARQSSCAVVLCHGYLPTHVQTEFKNEGVNHQAEEQSRLVVEDTAAVHRDDDSRICVQCNFNTRRDAGLAHELSQSGP